MCCGIERVRIKGLARAGGLWALLEAQALPEDERGAFLRREGLRDGDLERWQQEALSGLGATEPPGSSRRVRELERKMIKTEKRLREATALLDLQKKGGVTVLL